MRYYGKPELDQIKEIIDGEVRDGVHSLTASYLVRKYGMQPEVVQRVLSDLTAAGDLTVCYRLLCSGEHQNYDVDREFTSREEIPNYEIVCTKCGDHYVPNEDDIVLSFEPTDVYVDSLAQKR